MSALVALQQAERERQVQWEHRQRDEQQQRYEERQREDKQREERWQEERRREEQQREERQREEELARTKEPLIVCPPAISGPAPPPPLPPPPTAAAPRLPPEIPVGRVRMVSREQADIVVPNQLAEVGRAIIMVLSVTILVGRVSVENPLSQCRRPTTTILSAQ